MLTTSTILFLVFTFIVTNSALEDDVSQQYFSAKSYDYNHPPSFEEQNIYSDEDELKSRKVRQIESNDEVNKDSQVNGSLISIENIQSSTNSPRIIALTSKIPVAVTYDSNTDLLRSNNKQSNTTTNKTKKRRRTKRPNLLKNENTTARIQNADESIDKKESTSTTERISTTYSGPTTIVPKVFTKRPPEDNPVVKRVRQREPVVKILEESNFVYAHNGNFHYSFEGADGTKISSVGELKSFNDDKTGEAVVGSIFYKDNDGNDYSLSYTADENGYRPQGAHLPTPPPIPPAIARALAYLATKTTPEPVTESAT